MNRQTVQELVTKAKKLPVKVALAETRAGKELFCSLERRDEYTKKLKAKSHE